jgi:hypothetical protein
MAQGGADLNIYLDRTDLAEGVWVERQDWAFPTCAPSFGSEAGGEGVQGTIMGP